MKFLYIAPRYHTNQIPIMKGLVKGGHEVRFLSHYAGKVEDYSIIKPEIVGYSMLFNAWNYLYVNYFGKKNPGASDKRLLLGFPPIFRLSKFIKHTAPDIVIIRERSIYSIISYLLCCFYHYPAILYNQSPLWIEEKNDIAHRLVKQLTPKIRMTPVIGEKKENTIKDKNAFFVPFVMELRMSPDKKQYLREDMIHIFTVGKYEKRKNLQMIVEIVEELQLNYKLHLTIAGECSTDAHKKYYEKIREYVTINHLEGTVTLLKNLNREEMDKEYELADLFVIPSTQEPASISQLEAMAFSTPAICSDTNGTACYIINGYNGAVFQDNNKQDLLNKVEQIVMNPQVLIEMGKNSYQMIKEQYQFDNYYAGILECTRCLREERRK